MAALVIAINIRHRQPPQFVKVTHFPFRIGRAYDNDLILADETVSAHHLQIDRTVEGFTIQNLSNENGTWVHRQQLNSEPHVLNIPESVAMGHTELRFFQSDTAVAPTKTQMRLTRLTALCMDIRVAVVLLALYFAIGIKFALERQVIVGDWLEILLAELDMLLTPLALATITGFISRLLLHQWRFALQLSIASLVFIGNLLLPEVTHFLSYAFTDGLIARIFNQVAFVVGAIILFAWQLRAVSGMTRSRSGMTSAIIVLPIMLLVNVRSLLNTPEFRSQPQMHTLLRVGDTRLADNFATVDEYVSYVTQTLESALDEELERAKQKLEEKNSATDKASEIDGG